ncbi:phytanoyl-CoA dioxygenase family protein [Armatimonas sp.]|uniref:phytanoyl-CoA dioxygenase family protein n=1 Tax=Armatimonas sp. TaxID=1872638 RepID=UPI003753176E
MPTLFTDSTALLSDSEALRARGQRDGYLFFRGLLPPDSLLPVRADLLGVVAKHGWLADAQTGRLNVETLAAVPESTMRTDIGVSVAAYDDVQRLESVHRLPHHPTLLTLYKMLFNDEVLVHARHIIRMISPHPAVFPTPAHQDFPLVQGTQNTWTCWFPLGDCPRVMGSLKVLSGSHKLGYLPLKRARGAGGITVQTCPGEESEDDWREGDFALGDVLTFPALTVHQALPSQFKDRIRLSFDVRYQALSEPVEEKSLLPHCALTWEQIYESWESDALQYYWRKLPLNYSDWNPALLQPERRIC